MSALLDPMNRARWGIKWSLVAHTLAMFSLATIYTGITLDIQSISFIDNREFPGSDLFPPGPVGYQVFILDKAIGITPSVFAVVNNWLADGLLVSPMSDSVPQVFDTCSSQLYRCYVIYSTNCWAIALPGLMYLASVGALSSPPPTSKRL